MHPTHVANVVPFGALALLEVAVQLERHDALRLQHGHRCCKVGDLSAAGVVTIKAPSSGTAPLDLSGIVVGGSDVLQLSSGGSYILSKAQVPLARVNGGLPGDLSKAGIVSVNAAAGDNLTGLATGYSGIDTYLLAAGANYTLTNTQAAQSKVGAAALGVLTSTGVLTVVANPGADLSGLSTDGNDIIQLTAGSNYTLTLAQALTAQLVTTTNNGTIYGNLGQLDSSGALTLRTAAGTAPTDLSTQLSGITGIDAILLNAGQAYTLTGSQAAISQMGTTGTRADLGSTGVITLLAGSTSNLAAIKTDSNDIVQLDDATDYALTAAQAATARIGATGKAGVITSTGVLRVLAQVSADLSTLGTDSNDVIVLWPGQRYTLTTAQAARACVWTGSADGTQQDLSGAGFVRLIAISAAKSTEDLTGLKLESSDSIQLTAGVNYILTAQQAAIAQIGATGKAGDLVGGAANAGNITVKASASADLSGLKLDNLGDQILLTSVVGSNRCDYILSSSQVGIAQVDTGVVGDFGAAGTVILRAATTGEDLSTGSRQGSRTGCCKRTATASAGSRLCRGSQDAQEDSVLGNGNAEPPPVVGIPLSRCSPAAGKDGRRTARNRRWRIWLLRRLPRSGWPRWSRSRVAPR